MALLFGACFFLYFLKLSAGKGYYQLASKRMHRQKPSVNTDENLGSKSVSWSFLHVKSEQIAIWRSHKSLIN